MNKKCYVMVNDVCYVRRHKAGFECYPRDILQGVKLSDDRMNTLYQTYTKLLVEEANERYEKND